MWQVVDETGRGWALCYKREDAEHYRVRYQVSFPEHTFTTCKVAGDATRKWEVANYRGDTWYAYETKTEAEVAAEYMNLSMPTNRFYVRKVSDHA